MYWLHVLVIVIQCSCIFQNNQFLEDSCHHSVMRTFYTSLWICMSCGVLATPWLHVLPTRIFLQYISVVVSSNCIQILCKFFSSGRKPPFTKEKYFWCTIMIYLFIYYKFLCKHFNFCWSFNSLSNLKSKNFMSTSCQIQFKFVFNGTLIPSNLSRILYKSMMNWWSWGLFQ